MMTGAGLATPAGSGWFTRSASHSTYVGLVLPAEVIVSLGMGLSFVAMSSTALIGVQPQGRRGGQRPGQHHPADGGLPGRGADQHHRERHGVLGYSWPARPRP
jgi:hypothetical protein